MSEEIDDNLRVSFIDIENEEIEILDEHDFEYLVQNVDANSKI